MRIFVTIMMLTVALASSAFAGNVALTSLGASAQSYCGAAGATSPCDYTTAYQASLYITDGVLSNASEWVAPGSAINPYVVVDLGKLYTIDSVTIDGSGTPSSYIKYQVFTSATLAGAQTLIGTTTQAGGTQWQNVYSVSPASQLRYIFYDVATFGTDGGSTGWAYAQEISADQVPEPGTLGLIGAGLVALGFTLRRKK